VLKPSWSLPAFVLLAIAACGGRVSGVGGSGSNVAVSTGATTGTLSGGSGTVSVSTSGSTSGAVTSGSVVSSGVMSGTVVSVSGTVTMALPPCPTPMFFPPAGAVPASSNVVISAAGLPAGGEILFTTDGTTPMRTSPVYNSGTVGVQVTMGETFQAISTTMGATCTDSAVASATYTVGTTPVPEGGLLGPVPSAGCGKPAPVATGMWVRQPANCD